MPLTTHDSSTEAGRATLGGASGHDVPSARSEALRHAVDLAQLAPSVHDVQPSLIVLENDGITLRADRGGQVRVSEPLGRALVQSAGAALLRLRVALAERGWAVAVDRFPQPEDPDLRAHVRPVAGAPDSLLAALAPQVSRRRTNRRRSSEETVRDELLRALVGIAARENTQLILVLSDDHRRLVAQLIQQADGLPAETSSDADQTLILLATHSDGPDAWLRAGEALERVRRELACHGWAARPLTQPIEVPLTRTQLRSALTWNAHPQLLLRIGRAARTPATPSPAQAGDPATVAKGPEVPRTHAGRPWGTVPAPPNVECSQGNQGKEQSCRPGKS